jgi:hypothetical protein
MADSLTDLPYPSNVKYTDDEQEAHALFTQGVETSSSPEKDVKYLILYSAVLFFILSTSFADDFVKKLPYCDSEMACLAAKTILFTVGFMAVYWLVL